MKNVITLLTILLFLVSPALADTKGAAIQMTNTLENSQTDPAWNYAENINDGRGITFGIIGFCTGTYDGNILIKYYTTLNQDNPLAKYIPALNKIDTGRHNAAGGDGNPSVAGLNGFIKDVQNCKDPLFYQAQLYELDQLYWNPAKAQFDKLGYKYPLTLALLYDCSVRQGPDGMKSIAAKSRASDEKTFIKNFINQYSAALKREGLGDTSRMTGFTQVYNSGNYDLVTPFTFTAYGDKFTITGNIYNIDTPTEPEPPRPNYIDEKFSLWTDSTKLRGVCVFQRNVYPEFDGYDTLGPGPVGPPFKQSDFNELAKAGANLVVISHPGLYDEKYPYKVNTKIQNNLDSLINMAQKANLHVVIAFRTGPGRSEFTFYRDETWFSKSYLNENIWTDRNAQTAYTNMWKYTANRYKNNPSVVGYELMVEPNSNNILGIDDPENFYPKYKNTLYDWNQLALKITASVRSVDSKTPILIGGMGYSDVYWLSSIKPTADKKTVYIVHQYEPYQYTFNEDGSITYPGTFDFYGTQMQLNKNWLDNYFKPIDSFKKKYKVPVAVTEYGVYRHEPGAAAFMNDQMDLFEARGLNYAVWAWCPSYKPFADLPHVNVMNFKEDPKLYKVIKDHWKKNNSRMTWRSN